MNMKGRCAATCFCMPVPVLRTFVLSIIFDGRKDVDLHLFGPPGGFCRSEDEKAEASAGGRRGLGLLRALSFRFPLFDIEIWSAAKLQLCR